VRGEAERDLSRRRAEQAALYMDSTRGPGAERGGGEGWWLGLGLGRWGEATGFGDGSGRASDVTLGLGLGLTVVRFGVRGGHGVTGCSVAGGRARSRATWLRGGLHEPERPGAVSSFDRWRWILHGN
jgi:hypothetical protein